MTVRSSWIESFEVLPPFCRGSLPVGGGGLGSVALSMPLGLIFGRPGPPLSRAISSRCAATVRRNSATYTNFVVQDLVIRSHVVNFRRERWQKPDGDMMTAPLPAGISGHFGPELRRFVLAQYHQGQVTVPRLLAQLRAFGIVISKRQLVRLLIAGQDGFLAENREVLRAGLSSAAWVTVDDTGARHKAANGFCTQVGNAHFAWFGTTASKSRLNFLHLLRAGHSDYVINTEALDYMRQRALSSPVIARLAEHPQRFFTSQVAWTAHLDRLGISALEVNPDPVMVATEVVKSHGFLPDTGRDQAGGGDSAQ